jgi:hypothetical protein
MLSIALSDQRLRHLLLCLAVKLMAFGELAFVQSGKSNTHPGMNAGSARFDDDGDLIVVAVTEPEEGHTETMPFPGIRWLRRLRLL